MSNTVIKVENLSKQYRLGEIGTGSLAHDINRWWYNVRGKEDPYLKIGEANDRTKVGTSEYVWSLKDIDFSIGQGEAVGVIGRNGAGKSTLLKVLSQVTAPTTGSVKVKGRIASLLEVGTGFHPDLSGRDNIYLNGAILGMRKAEIKRKFDEIVDFAGVERYIDTPVKRYSSGMYVRLAFAVSAHLESEILIVDEVLAVGDAEFQKKCIGKMNDVSKGEGRTVLFVSHNIGSIMQLCNKGLFLAQGRVELSGDINKVVDKYLSNSQGLSGIYKREGITTSSPIAIDEVVLKNKTDFPTTSFKYSEPIMVNISLNINENLRDNGVDNLTNCSLFLTILDSNKQRVFSAEQTLIDKKTNYTLEIAEKFLSNGRYSFHMFVHTPGVNRYDELEDVCQFEITDDNSIFLKYHGYDHGKVFGNYTWR